jgi:GNAT superfamily N-acetyltransferase
MTATLSPYTASDRQPLIEAIDAVCAESRWMDTPCFQPTPAWNHALQSPDCPNHLLLVSRDGGRAVGWCRLFPLAGCNAPAYEAKLGIGLLPAYRGCGLGKALVDRAVGWARKVGITRLVLTTKPGNQRAIRLFERFGFVAVNNGENGTIDMVAKL